jgi:hypothetical protein
MLVITFPSAITEQRVVTLGAIAMWSMTALSSPIVSLSLIRCEAGLNKLAD